MEAYILHINKSWWSNREIRSSSDEYSAWSTERQAYVAAIDFLKKENYWMSDKFNSPALVAAVKCLIQSNNFEEVVELLNEQPGDQPNATRYSGTKFLFKIIKSTFKGSPLE